MTHRRPSSDGAFQELHVLFGRTNLAVNLKLGDCLVFAAAISALSVFGDGSCERRLEEIIDAVDT